MNIKIYNNKDTMSFSDHKMIDCKKRSSPQSIVCYVKSILRYSNINTLDLCFHCKAIVQVNRKLRI